MQCTFYLILLWKFVVENGGKGMKKIAGMLTKLKQSSSKWIASNLIKPIKV